MIIKIPMALAKELDPNYKGFWTHRARATRILREATCLCAKAQCESNPPKYEKAELSITLIVQNWRYIRDADNCLASLKPAIDGCVDAEIIQGDNDKHLLYRLPIMWEKNQAQAPMIILEFKELKGDIIKSTKRVVNTNTINKQGGKNPTK